MSGRVIFSSTSEVPTTWRARSGKSRVSGERGRGAAHGFGVANERGAYRAKLLKGNAAVAVLVGVDDGLVDNLKENGSEETKRK